MLGGSKTLFWGVGTDVGGTISSFGTSRSVEIGSTTLGSGSLVVRGSSLGK